MLSYQHLYHAGNHVDCQKHFLLVALIDALKAAYPALRCVDTHAGRGMYDLQAREAQKIQEYKTGIHRLWGVEEWPEIVDPLLAILADLNRDGICRYYPGSPWILQDLLRDTDRLDVHEIHPQELRALEYMLGDLPLVTIHDTDGWTAMHQTQKEKTLFFIDPSYELKSEYTDLLEHIRASQEQNPDACYMIWYPMLNAGLHKKLLAGLPKPFVQSEIIITPLHSADGKTTRGLYGTGIALINAPEGFEKTVRDLSEWLAPHIGVSTETKQIN